MRKKADKEKAKEVTRRKKREEHRLIIRRERSE